MTKADFTRDINLDSVTVKDMLCSTYAHESKACAAVCQPPSMHKGHLDHLTAAIDMDMTCSKLAA